MGLCGGLVVIVGLWWLWADLWWLWVALICGGCGFVVAGGYGFVVAVICGV